MKIETLKDRIQKATEKIEKINGTLIRHNTQLTKKAKALTDRGIDLNNYNRYTQNSNDHDNYWELSEYESKLEDIANNNKKLAEASNTLTKLTEQLNNQLAKEESTNNLIPEVLNIFLENWKQKCITFYKDLATEYITLVGISHTEYLITLEELQLLTEKKYSWKSNCNIITQMYTSEETEDILNGNITEWKKIDVQREIRHRTIKSFVNSQCASDMAIVEKVIDNKVINTVTLNKILDDDVKIKKEMFINRIKEVIGDIKDLSRLTIGAKGDINGIAVGVKCNAKVETIGCGGYNTQCFHYRILVNSIK